MALTDQPYLPLFVDDWMNNTNLKLCSPGAHGVMISIMCLMHKSNDGYGIILLKQKFKQNSKQILNFATQIAKLTSFEISEIELYLTELIQEQVLKIEGDFLKSWRMIKDGNTSVNRAKTGSVGGKKTASYFAKAKVQANTVIGSEIENEDVIVNKNEIIMPFNSEKFINKWNVWKEYRSQIKKPYKSQISEQAALKMLSRYSEAIACEMIEQSISNSWQGLFEIKQNNNGNTKDKWAKLDAFQAATRGVGGTNKDS